MTEFKVEVISDKKWSIAFLDQKFPMDLGWNEVQLDSVPIISDFLNVLEGFCNKADLIYEGLVIPYVGATQRPIIVFKLREA